MRPGRSIYLAEVFVYNVATSARFDGKLAIAFQVLKLAAQALRPGAERPATAAGEVVHTFECGKSFYFEELDSLSQANVAIMMMDELSNARQSKMVGITDLDIRIDVGNEGRTGVPDITNRGLHNHVESLRFIRGYHQATLSMKNRRGQMQGHISLAIRIRMVDPQQIGFSPNRQGDIYPPPFTREWSLSMDAIFDAIDDEGRGAITVDQIMKIMKSDKVFYSTVRSLLQLPISGGNKNDMNNFVSILGSDPIERAKFSSLALRAVTSISGPPTLPVKKSIPVNVHTRLKKKSDVGFKRIPLTKVTGATPIAIARRNTDVYSNESAIRERGHVHQGQKKMFRSEGKGAKVGVSETKKSMQKRTSSQHKSLTREGRTNRATPDDFSYSVTHSDLAHPITRTLLAGLRNNPSLLARRARLRWRDKPAIKASEWTQVGEPAVVPNIDDINVHSARQVTSNTRDNETDSSFFSSSDEESSEITAAVGNAESAWMKNGANDSHSSQSENNATADDSPAESAWGTRPILESNDSTAGYMPVEEPAWNQIVANEAPVESAWGQLAVDTNSDDDEGSTIVKRENRESELECQHLDTNSDVSEESAIADEAPAESAWASAKNFESDDDENHS